MCAFRSLLIFPALAMAVCGADLPPLGGAIKLFNGKNLKGFDTFLRDRGLNSDPEKVFHVRKGEVVVSGKEYGYFITKQEYENYYLRAEFKWGLPTYEPRKDKARDSGILFHVVGPDKVWPKSIEYQMIEGGTGDVILVDGAQLNGKGTPRGKNRFDRFNKGPWKDVAGYRDPNGDPEKPLGEWNVLELLCDGDTVKYWVNGKLVNEGSGANPSRGRILFQSEGAELYFRNIELRPLRKK
jgi:hypothetical protein